MSLVREATSSAFAAVVSGIISNVIMFPLGRVRIEMTMHTKRLQLDGTNDETDEKLEFFACLRKIVKEEGFLGLYKGMDSMLVSNSINQMFFFYIYTFLKFLRLKPPHMRLNPLENLSIATIAGAVSTVLSNPFWVVNMRLTVQDVSQPEYSGMLDCFQVLLKRHGLEVFYSGIWPALILVSNPAIQFVCYEQMTRLIMMYRGKAAGTIVSTLTSMEYFFLGALAKSVATLITYPYLLLKSRMFSGKFHISNMSEVFYKIIKEEGFLALYKGLAPKFVQTVLNAAFMFATYEYFLKWSKKIF